MTDLAIAPTHAPQTAPRQIARTASDWLKRLSAPRQVIRPPCPTASELAEITSIERYDIAPWLSF
jgi:hypothetical protein